MTERRSVTVDGLELSALTTGPGPPQLLLVHGTFWSRVWEPVLPALGDSITAAAIDFPGFGRSGGELAVENASIPHLADLTMRAADALGAGELTVAGHDIGGAVAQHLAAHEPTHAPPSLLIWGEDDEFQSIAYAERFAAEVPAAALARIPAARHIPTEDDPDRVAGELLAFLELITVTQEM